MAVHLYGQQASVTLPHALNAIDGKHVYGVVLAGGSGERLWPLSRAAMPKQLLAVGSEKSLLEQAIDRLVHIMPRDHVFVSTTADYQAPINNVVGMNIGGILVEPGARNTGPALLLSCLRLYEKDPEALIIFVPADPFIPAEDTASFVACLQAMVEHSVVYPVISLCGIKPTYPATGFGYIAYDDAREAVLPANASQANAFPVIAFKEKPSLALAQKYVDSGMMLWNTGIFCATAQTFLAECLTHAPELFAQVSAVHNGVKKYDDVTPISIDYAVLEKSKNVAVVPATFSWCDVGNVAVFLSLQKTDTATSVVTVDAHNNLVSAPGKTVALIGVDDLCVIETADSLLICKQSEAEKVRNVVQQLKKNGMTKNL
jgi:mannose-1-phosphate guanylyltransferase/mannose-6-phosphate isomerase